MILFYTHHVYRTLRKTRITKGRNRPKSSFLQETIQDASNRLFYHNIIQITLGNRPYGLQYLLFDLVLHDYLVSFPCSSRRRPDAP